MPADRHQLSPAALLTLPAVTLLDAPITPREPWHGNDAMIVPVRPAPQEKSGRVGESRPVLAGQGADVAALYDIDLVAEAERADGSAGSPGWTATVRLPRTLPDAWEPVWVDLPGTIVLVGIGAGRPEHWRQAGLAASRAVAGLETAALTAGTDLDADGLRSLAEGFALGAYRLPRNAQSPAKTKQPAEKLTVIGKVDGSETAVRRARAAARATWLARHLAATPSNLKNPAWMAEQAKALVAAAGSRPGGKLSVEVHDERWLAKHGFDATLAVGQASATPPRLVTVTWQPRAGSAPSVALVGKGITFDTGGLSLKPPQPMIPMKTDMAGAATALATVLAAAELSLPVTVTAVLPLAENAIGDSAYRPGDIVTVFDGTTVEIGNTDAEGRMVLADAMSWAAATLDPDEIIDIATLTGAATLGLGRHHAALYSPAEDFAEALSGAGRASGEQAWHMPLVEDYRSSLDSSVADLSHIATSNVGAGSITAALFLQHFAAGRRWAHLDIAGVGRNGSGSMELPAQAPTGFGARLLLRYLEDLAQS
ncbi:leucyl aminopeptidase family protein [Bogoriella caseilytica]|uniref:Probable cytosol aminopeptidase n=1 Tax=Bogoriella caseilytica TaxID=56055 RepID=A0A3N2BEN0_9MICO|nr:leucyl aminopeptidase family protein [Bogoriella caseilytica]ROR73692.1 leucyl aminopeptidase [Bogoriella caseilytica]